MKQMLNFKSHACAWKRVVWIVLPHVVQTRSLSRIAKLRTPLHLALFVTRLHRHQQMIGLWNLMSLKERLFFAYPFFWSWTFRSCRSPLVTIMLDENAMKRMRNLSLLPDPVGVVACRLYSADDFFFEIASLLTVSFRLRCPLCACTIMLVIDFQLRSCGDVWLVQKLIFTTMSLRLSSASHLESKASLSRCWIVLCRDTTGVYYTINPCRQRVIKKMSLVAGHVCMKRFSCVFEIVWRKKSLGLLHRIHPCLFAEWPWVSA